MHSPEEGRGYRLRPLSNHEGGRAGELQQTQGLMCLVSWTPRHLWNGAPLRAAVLISSMECVHGCATSVQGSGKETEGTRMRENVNNLQRSAIVLPLSSPWAGRDAATSLDGLRQPCPPPRRGMRCAWC